ncbi:MAG: hypothetical protein KDB27_11470 [Planctomycetales bacterium]|nr:hypothetical protein [Planctomycetales bacterium]
MSFCKTLLAILTVGLCSSLLSADTILDDFSVGSFISPPFNFAGGGFDEDHVWAGYRQFIYPSRPDDPAILEVDSSGTGSLDFDSPESVEALVLSYYASGTGNRNDPPTVPSLDFSVPDAAVQIYFGHYLEPAGTAALNLFVADSSGKSGGSSIFNVTQSTEPFVASLHIDSQQTGLDRSDIAEVGISLIGIGNSVSLSIDKIVFVPEPSAAVFSCLLLPVLAFRRQRK